MPLITDEEYKKFKELLDEEREREKLSEINREVYIKKLMQYKDMLLKINKSYGPIEVYSVTFAKWLNEFFNANKIEEFNFNWDRIKNYITDACLEVEERFGITLRQAFRKNMKARGFSFHINRKYNMITVKREKPKSNIS